MVDSLQKIDEETLVQLNLNKARMTLVDKNRSNELLEAMPNPTQAAGGSAQTAHSRSCPRTPPARSRLPSRCLHPRPARNRRPPALPQHKRTQRAARTREHTNVRGRAHVRRWARYTQSPRTNVPKTRLSRYKFCRGSTNKFK